MRTLNPISNIAALLGSNEPINELIEAINENLNELNGKTGGGGVVTEFNGQTGKVTFTLDDKTLVNPKLNGTVLINGQAAVAKNELDNAANGLKTSVEKLKKLVTTTEPGLMAPADKVKLDGLSNEGRGSASVEAICSSQMYGALNIVVDGGSGASLDGEAAHTNATKKVEFDAQMTIKVPETGWYRIDVADFFKNDGTGFHKGVYLNNGVAKFPAVVGISTVAQTHMTGKSGYLSFNAKCEKGVSYRISLNSSEAFSAQNVRLTVTWVGE